MVVYTSNGLVKSFLASGTTAFVISVIGECLDNIAKIGVVKVVSVTTDGFITDIKDLELHFLQFPFTNHSFYKISFVEVRFERGF